MIPLPPVISKFPFVGIHPLFDIYSIFVFEPMQNLSLHISKLLKEFLVSYLKDYKKVRKSITTIYGEGKIMYLIKKPDVLLLNNFIRDVQWSSPGYLLNVDFYKG